MSSFIDKRRCLALLLATAVSTQGHAMGFSMSSSSKQEQDNYTTNRPWGNLGPSKPAPQYQPPQPSPNAYYIGAAPGTGWYPGQMPTAVTTVNDTPVVEVEVSDTTAYERQNLVYTVRVVSTGNLAVLDDKLPRIEGATLELIDGPVATTRGYNRASQIVNTYHYRLTPLRPGEIVVPAIRFEGKYAANNPPNTPQGTGFDIAAADAYTLQVQPADPAVKPWLPLHDLRLQTRLEQHGRLKAGQPVTLELELTARGAPGNQLPSLAGQLQSPDYRVYRDETATTAGISTSGRYVTGSRKETYTLIPLADGWIRLPDINVAWWDIDTHEARLAGIPPTGTAAASTAPVAASGTHEPLFPLYAWVPMIVALALIAGYLLGTWQRSRTVFRQMRGWLVARAWHAAHGSLQLAGRLSPVRHLQSLRAGLALLMPQSVRVWMCTRCIAGEDNPHVWCAAFRERICRDLDLNGQASLYRIAEHIIANNPRSEPARVRALMHSLEAALYGGMALDFPVWKREIQQQLRPNLLRRRRARLRKSGNRLPALNPRNDILAA